MLLLTGATGTQSPPHSGLEGFFLIWPNNMPNLIAKFVVLALAVFAPVKLPAANHCVVLQYHHFSKDTPAITSVTPEQFDSHLQYLKANDFNVMPLRDVVTLLSNQLEVPEKCVSLTVDDAYQSVYTTAYPKLKALGWPMTVFVNSQAIDDNNSAFMSWEQIREMSSHGFSFENHAHSHSHLIRRKTSETRDDWEQRITSEILTAQNRISEETGISPTLFAYPYGEYNPEVINIVRQLGFTGFGQQSGPIWPDANFAALPRFPMAAQYANLPGFITKVNSLPMPVVTASPENPLLAENESRPELVLKLAENTYTKENIQCFVNGSKDVTISWPMKDTLAVKPNFDLPAGRSRTNCTMPSNRKGRFHWYSHNWIRRNHDGSWYREY